MLRIGLFVHVHLLILVYHVFPQLVCANSFFDRSFVYGAPTLWNALDLDIRSLPYDTFKKSDKTHLSLKYFVN